MNERRDQESDTRHHTANIKRMLDELMTHLREDVHKVSEPKAQALFEVSAEVLGGLHKAFEDYEQQNEPAWQTTPVHTGPALNRAPAKKGGRKSSTARSSAAQKAALTQTRRDANALENKKKTIQERWVQTRAVRATGRRHAGRGA